MIYDMNIKPLNCKTLLACDPAWSQLDPCCNSATGLIQSDCLIRAAGSVKRLPMGILPPLVEPG